VVNIIKKIYITHGFHRGEYTDHVAKALERELSDRGYNVQRRKFPLSETGWGKALAGKPKREVERALTAVDDLAKLDYFNKFETDQSVLIVDLHRGEENTYNPQNLKAEELKFRSYKYEKKESGIFYMDFTEFIKGYRDGFPLELHLLIYSKKFPNTFLIEIPHIYRPASEKFLQTIEKRIKCKLSGKVLEGYFGRVSDKYKTMQKYPPETLANIIANGIEEQILPKFNIPGQE
jgi:hypothetical protein